MAIANSVASVGFCSVCAEPLRTNVGCLTCLLRAGLDGADQSNGSNGGITFGDFEIERRDDGSFCELGRGAMGVTYRATDKVLHRTVALKVIETPAAPGDSQPVRERFLREARAAAALRHPNVAAVFHFGASAEVDRCYCAMELVEGETLEARVRRDGPLDLPLALEIALQVTRALLAAAERGLVHRDLKPGNIMLTGGENAAAKTEVKVIDFGLAKAASDVAGEMELTHGGFVGTPAFASPEQFAGRAVDARSDIYALGVTLWFALTGRLPFPGRTIEEIRERQAGHALPVKQLQSRAVPQCVLELLRSCLAIDPAARPASAGELMGTLESCRARSSRGPWPRKVALAVSLAAVLTTAVGAYVFPWQKIATSREAKIAPPVAHAAAPLLEKSIAVLPFQNLSQDQENAFFADGVQDEILSNLAKIADLKVISRTSVMQYKNAATRNLREIAQQLGVAHVLEGSVQRAANRVRVNAQLIDARTDAHIWAEHYDRDLADIFAIQSEIAKAIAEQLQAKISAGEKAAVAERPTRDLAAYDLYIRAVALLDQAGYASQKDQEKGFFQAVELFNQAIARDPAFLLAYCRLAEAHDELYFQSHDHTPARLALAKAAINAAFRLKPDSGEAHLASATHLYHGYFDYDHARDELAIAVRTLPNNARIFEWTGYIDRRQGRWHDAVRNLQRASELDPRNVKILTGAAVTYNLMHDYGQARETLDRLIALEPNNNFQLLFRAWIDVAERADTRPLHAVIEKILRDDPAWAGNLVEMRLFLASAEHDPVAADRAVAALTENTFGSRNAAVDFSRYYVQGLVARMKGDTVAARVAFTAARAQQEEAVRARPDDGLVLCVLGLIDAALGRKEEALREGRRAVELLPVAKNALDGPDVLYFYAVICAWTGERDLAIEQMETLVKIPAGPSYGKLRLDPEWDPLRGDPRFEKIVVSLKPKDAK